MFFPQPAEAGPSPRAKRRRVEESDDQISVTAASSFVVSGSIVSSFGGSASVVSDACEVYTELQILEMNRFLTASPIESSQLESEATLQRKFADQVEKLKVDLERISNKTLVYPLECRDFEELVPATKDKFMSGKLSRKQIYEMITCASFNANKLSLSVGVSYAKAKKAVETRETYGVFSCPVFSSPGHPLAFHVEELVREYYRNIDNVHTSSNTRDCIKIKSKFTGDVVTYPKRWIFCSLREFYAKFCVDHPGSSVDKPLLH
jgi:hypothetical protein